MIIDPELLHLQIEVAARDVIGLPFQADPELLESIVAAEQTAEHDNGRAQVGHVRVPWRCVYGRTAARVQTASGVRQGRLQHDSGGA